MNPSPCPARAATTPGRPVRWPGLLLGSLAVGAMAAAPVAAQGRAGLRATASVVAVVTPAGDSLTRWLHDAIGSLTLHPGGVQIGYGDRSRPWVATLVPRCDSTPGARCDPRLIISFVGN